MVYRLGQVEIEECVFFLFLLFLFLLPFSPFSLFLLLAFRCIFLSLYELFVPTCVDLLRRMPSSPTPAPSFPPTGWPLGPPSTGPRARSRVGIG